MPIIENIQPKTFTKKNHRPWTLLSEALATEKPTKPFKKTDNKLAANRQQTDSKLPAKLIANRQQTDNKTNTKKETDNKLAAEPTALPTTNRQQTDSKPTTSTPFSMLVGLQRNCMLFIYQSCQINRSKTSEKLTLEHISQFVKTSPGTIKNVIQRLVHKNCLVRTGFKNGRGGWSTYEIPDNLHTEILRQESDNKLAANWQQTGSKLATEPTAEPTTNLPSSSSFLNMNIKETSTTNDRIPPEFEGIEIQSLEPYGFTEKHLLQIIKKSGFTKEMIQESIDAFAFDLVKNNKITKVSQPLSYFMGTLVKGYHYNKPENYVSPQQESMRLYLERKKAEQEREEQLLEEAAELALNDWKKTMSDADIEALIDKHMNKELPQCVREDSTTRKNILYTYYTRNIWPEEKKKFFKKMHEK